MLIDLLSKYIRLNTPECLPKLEIDPQQAIALHIAWLSRAQDFNAGSDYGVARHYDLVTGWSASYPETTGYIIPTFLEQARRLSIRTLRGRAEKMLDWLVEIQYPDGAFQGGLIDSEPRVRVTFNTGQALIGLAAGVRQFGKAYLDATHRAASWLVRTQDGDGAWRRFPTPFASPGEKSYETHVSLGLLDAAKATGEMRYADAAKRNLSWAAGKQLRNGFVRDCCLTDPAQPLTHTLGYFLRGMLGGYQFFRERWMIDAALKTARPLAAAIDAGGFLPGRLDEQFRPRVRWACLTGSAQIAECFVYLWEETGDHRWLDNAQRLLAYVRRTIRNEGPAGVCGAIAGSWPYEGRYCQNQFPNWAAKFSIDAHQALLNAISVRSVETPRDTAISAAI